MASFGGYPCGEPDDSGPEMEGTTGGPELPPANHLRRLIHELVKATCAQGYWYGYSADEDVQHILDRVRGLEARLSPRCLSVGTQGLRCERPYGHSGQCGSNGSSIPHPCAHGKYTCELCKWVYGLPEEELESRG